MDVEGRSAIVTGASTGIGRATAKALADAGAEVGLAARTTAKLESLAGKIEAGGGDALVLPTDVSDREQVESMIMTARDTFDGLDILVNNAGVGHWDREGVLAGDLDEWTKEVDVNLLGLMYGTHFAANVMQEEGGTSSISDRDQAGTRPNRGRVMSPASLASVASRNRQCEPSVRKASV